MPNALLTILNSINPFTVMVISALSLTHSQMTTPPEPGLEHQQLLGLQYQIHVLQKPQVTSCTLFKHT